MDGVSAGIAPSLAREEGTARSQAIATGWDRVLESTREADSLRLCAWRLGCTGWAISLRKKPKASLRTSLSLGRNSFRSTYKKKM